MVNILFAERPNMHTISSCQRNLVPRLIIDRWSKSMTWALLKKDCLRDLFSQLILRQSHLRQDTKSLWFICSPKQVRASDMGNLAIACDKHFSLCINAVFWADLPWMLLGLLCQTCWMVNSWFAKRPDIYAQLNLCIPPWQTYRRETSHTSRPNFKVFACGLGSMKRAQCHPLALGRRRGKGVAISASLPCVFCVLFSLSPDYILITTFVGDTTSG